MSAIAQLIIEQGRQAAEARAARGQIWGRAVENISAIPGQVMAQQRQQQELEMQKKESAARLALQGQQGQVAALQIGEKTRAASGASAVAQAVQSNTQLDPGTGHYVTDHEAVIGSLMKAGFPAESKAYADEATKAHIDLNTAQHSDLQAQLDKAAYLKNQLEPVVNEPDPAKQQIAYAVLRGNQQGLNSQHPVLGKLPPILDLPTLTAHFNAAETDAERLGDAFKKSETALNLSKAKQAEAEAALAISKAGPPNQATLLKTLDSIIPATDTANANLRAATTARITNARTHEEALKAIEDAQNQVGQISVAKQKAPITVGVNVASQAGKNKLGELSDAAVEQQAIAYLTSGQMPAMGMGAPAIRAQILNKAAELDPTKAIALQKATFTADQGSLAVITKTMDKVTAFETTAGKNLDQFLALADKIPDTGVPWLNTPVRLLTRQAVGDANMAAIDAARTVALREIARVTSDPNLTGVLSDSARQEVSALSPTNATLPQIKAVAKVLKKDMANVRSSLNEQRNTIQGRLGGTGTAPGIAKPSDPLGIR